MFNINELTDRKWTEDDLGVSPAGDVGGDVQASDALSRRFAQKIAGSDLYVVIDFAAFVAIDDINGDANDLNQPHGITVMVSYDHCSDPNNLDSSSHSDIRYWDHQEQDEMDTVEAVIARIGTEDLSEAVNQMGA